MKKNLLLVLLLLPFQSISQSYYPLLDSVNNSWSIIANALAASPENTNCNYPYQTQTDIDHMQTGNDTVINGIPYKILNQNSFCTFGYIREDTSSRKVYFMNTAFDPEELIYDFSMQIGDIIPLQFNYQGPYNYWENGMYTLDSIIPISTIQGSRNAYYLNCHSCGVNNTVQWIEGVGNLHCPVYTYGMNSTCGGPFSFCLSFQQMFCTFVICYSHDQITYFDSCSYSEASIVYDSCNFFTPISSTRDFNYSRNVKISKNPFHDFTEISITDNSIMNPKLILYNSQGRMIKEIQVKNNSAIIQRESLSNGIYSFKITGTDGKYAMGKLLIQ